MKYIETRNLKPGMIIARPLYDEDMKKIVDSQKMLNKKNIREIHSLKYPGIYIYEKGDEDVLSYKPMLSEELKEQTKKSLEKLQLESILECSENIVEQIRKSEYLKIDMISLRSFDKYTYGHSLNVAIMSIVVGIAMGLDEEELEDLCLAGLLHDIGKTKISLRLLRKKNIDKKDYEKLKKHVEYSYEIIKDNENISDITKKAVIEHHENEDGSGYPFGLKSNEISLQGKILHAADVFDALTNKRPYSNGITHAEAMEYLIENSGILFDEKVISCFFQNISPYPIGIKVLLSTGEKGFVVETNKKCLARPKVKTTDNKIINLEKKFTITIVKEIS